MSRHQIIRRRAHAEVEAARRWYNRQRPGLGEEMVAATKAKIREVFSRPEQFAVCYAPEVRRALVERFPYAIFFIVQERLIAVIAVLHTSQDAGARLEGRN